MRQRSHLSALLAAPLFLLQACGSSGSDSPDRSAGAAPRAAAASLPGERSGRSLPSAGAPAIAAPQTAGAASGSAPDPGPKPGLLFGVYPSDSPTEMYRQFLPLCEYLTNETGCPVELYVAPSYEAGLDMIRKGQVDLFRSGAGAFGRLVLQTKDRAPVLVAVEQEGEKKESRFRGAFITRQDAPIAKLEDLVGKSFAFGDRRSTMGTLVPRKILKERGVATEGLARFDHLKSHDDVALAVLNQEFDAGACKAPTAEKYKERGIRILEYTPDFPSKPIYARHGLETARVEAVRKALLALDVGTKEHAEILRAVEAKLAGFGPGKVEDYEAFARFLGDESDEPAPLIPPSK